MKTTSKLAVFAVALVAMLGVGAMVGATIGPAASTDTARLPVPEGQGVVSAQARYRFVPLTTLTEHGGGFQFTIEGPNGQRVRRFNQTHERDLHFVLVNRELTSFHHVHPNLDDNGVWSIDLPALAPGSYRAVADFWVHDGPALALGIDLAIAGDYQPTEAPDPATHASVDGYDVELHSEQGDGGVDTMSLTIRKNGQVVNDLQPYLGASGHLIAFRAGDLAYAHVHPLGYDNGAVRFEATLDAAGRHRLFFDFKRGDTVRTAEFTFEQGLVTGDASTMEH
jgi:hypothetical protein